MVNKVASSNNLQCKRAMVPILNKVASPNKVLSILSKVSKAGT